MRITYLKLRNYAGILAGMKKNEVEFSFKDAKNKIILLIGENASGKTTILSTLHPFAYPGSMDIRNGSSLIAPGQQGLKEIHYDKNGKEIKIKHIYTPTQTGHTVKSYITIDGEEKNPNGNVTSFHSMVETFLDIEPDYMKLTRLGANVSGLINMKSTERKGLATSLLSDVDIYSGFYKKVNMDVRDLKVLLKSVSDKLSKLNISDKEQYESQIHTQNEIIRGLTTSLEEIKKEKYTLEHEYSALDGRTLTAEIDNIYRRITSIDEEIAKLTREKNKISQRLTLTKEKDEIELMLEQMKMKSMELRLSFNSQMEALDTKIAKRKECELQLLEFKDTGNLIILQETKRTIETKLKTINSLPKRDISVSKTDLFLALSEINQLEKYLGELSSYDDSLVDEVYMLRKSKNVERTVANLVSDLDQQLSSIEREILTITSIQSPKKEKECTILYTLHDNCDTCPYYKEYHEEKPEVTVTKLSELNSRKESLLHTRDRLLLLPYIDKQLEYCVQQVKEFKEKYPYLVDMIGSFTQLLEDRTVDKSFIYTLIEYVEMQEEKEKLEIDLYKITEEISKLAEGNSSKDIQITINLLTEDIVDIETKIEPLQKELQQLDGEIEFYTSNFNLLVTLESIEANLSELTTEQENLNVKFSELAEKGNRIKEIDKRLTYCNHELSNLTMEMKKASDNLFKLQYNLHQYNELMEQTDSLSNKYEELNILREALSSSKGIPLLFMQLYLKNTRILANKLLENVFDGDLEISEFTINEKEFKIPYIRHGIEVSDVVFASQGESSFLSLALSFALMQQSLKSYNVMLLDEIDAALDMKNRNLFISILEQQLDEIGCEQVFMITHNNVFDNYPVDILLTSRVEIDNYRNIGTLI